MNLKDIRCMLTGNENHKHLYNCYMSNPDILVLCRYIKPDIS